jgi:hypothetical protein
MKRLIQSLRSQSIGVLALFIALGGTGYAAISIPRNSVGSRQLRNGAVTTNKIAKGAVSASKLDSKSIAGTTVFWAQIAQSGQVIRSSQPVTTSAWPSGAGNLSFRSQLSEKCFTLSNAIPIGGGSTGSVSTVTDASVGGQAKVVVFMTPTGSVQLGPLSVAVAVICPV